jgi:large subunit ribosomal protein L22
MARSLRELLKRLNMEVRSTQKYIITSPQKLREVVSLIKGLSPTKAFEVLPFTGKRASGRLRKVVGSALANAKEKGVKEENLYFKEIQITEGPRLKRWRAGARGMAKPYKRRMSHIRIVLGVKDEKVIKKKASLLKSEAKDGSKIKDQKPKSKTKIKK